MTVGDWMSHTVSSFWNHGMIVGTQHTAKNTFHSVLGRIDPHIGGQNIYEDEWDLLIVIDACRSDLFNEVAPKYDWLPDDIQTRRSVGTATRNWMQRTFTEDRSVDMAATDYVVGNPYSQILLDETDFGFLDEVHRYAWNEEYGTVRARPITERAVDVHRSRNPGRLLVHYLPPHFPSIPDNLGYNIDRDAFDDPEGGVEWDGVWEAAKAGAVSRERIWRSYRANLEYVLNDVALLLQNIDAERAILTSDHGNAFGEWWTWGHPPDVYVPVNRLVPYVEVEATDEETLVSTLDRKNVNSTSESVEEQLKALGYT